MYSLGGHKMARILAFGDSLTAGYHNQGMSFAPWAPLLSRLLGASVCDYVGLSGMRTDQMVEMLDHEAITDVADQTWPGLRRKLSHAQEGYDVVIIMSGTNDVADRQPTQTVLNSIEALHKVAHAAGARSVAMTIPESLAALRVDWLGRARREANEAIRAWATSQPSELVHFVDAATLVPFTQSGSPRLWEFDGLHMSAAGYATFGRGLAPLVESFVESAARSRLARVRSERVAVPASTSASQATARAERPTDTAPGPRWRIGARVRIHGLQNARQHNGKLGRVGKARPLNERVAVTLDEGGPPLSVRMENLELVDTRASEGTPPPDVFEVD